MKKLNFHYNIPLLYSHLCYKTISIEIYILTGETELFELLTIGFKLILQQGMQSKTRYLPSWVKGLLYVEVLWGVKYLCMSILLFSVFGFLWYCVDVVIYGGAGSLKTFFFTMVDVSGIVSHLEFTFPYHFYINVTLFRLISLFMLIFFYICLSGNF